MEAWFEIVYSCVIRKIIRDQWTFNYQKRIGYLSLYETSGNKNQLLFYSATQPLVGTKYFESQS